MTQLRGNWYGPGSTIVYQRKRIFISRGFRGRINTITIYEALFNTIYLFFKFGWLQSHKPSDI
jgi:hypothetical protein